MFLSFSMLSKLLNFEMAYFFVSPYLFVFWRKTKLGIEKPVMLDFIVHIYLLLTLLQKEKYFLFRILSMPRLVQIIDVKSVAFVF